MITCEKEYKVSIESHTPPLTLDQIKINKFASGNLYIYEQTRQILVVWITKNIHYKIPNPYREVPCFAQRDERTVLGRKQLFSLTTV